MNDYSDERAILRDALAYLPISMLISFFIGGMVIGFLIAASAGVFVDDGEAARTEHALVTCLSQHSP